jgi:hypothetical protein
LPRNPKIAESIKKLIHHLMLISETSTLATKTLTDKASLKFYSKTDEMQSPVKYTETRQSFPTRPQKVAYGTGLFCTQDVKVSKKAYFAG